MKYIISAISLFIVTISNSQSNLVDDKYLEDQFYIGLHYNSLRNSPTDFNQNKFSSTLSFGIIRDIPFNKRRNIGMGAGLGLALSSTNSNLKFDEDSFLENATVIDPGSFKKNKWNVSKLELPIEIRWRTSTAEIYKFWRVYLGFKTSYLLSSRYKFESENLTYKLKSLPFRKVNTGVMLNAGNNTWNLSLYMGLRPVFNDEFRKLNPELKDLKDFSVGLIFYILWF